MKYVILGHENPDIDSLVSGYLLEKIMKEMGYSVSFCIVDDVSEENVKLLNKYEVDINKWLVKELPIDAFYILVDHHDRDVPGNIVAIIDHHPTSKNFDNIYYYQNEFASSTACLIAQNCATYIDEKDLKLVCLSALVDTASFHSTKTRESDKVWVKSMCTKYSFSYEELYRDGLCLTDLTNLEDVYLNGFKKYEFNGFIVHSSYVQIDGYEKYNNEIDYLLNKVKEYREKQKVDLFLFIVYDMNYFYTKVYFITEEEIVIKEFDKYASRGNTIIPMLENTYCKK